MLLDAHISSGLYPIMYIALTIVPSMCRMDRKEHKSIQTHLVLDLICSVHLALALEEVGLLGQVLCASHLRKVWQVGCVLLNAALDILADVLGVLGQVQICAY